MQFSGQVIEAIRTALSLAKRDAALSKEQVTLVTDAILSMESEPATIMHKKIFIRRVRLSGAGVIDVSREVHEQDKSATHLSIYIQDANGDLEWLEDHDIRYAHPTNTYQQVMLRCAKYSMEYQIPICPFQF